MSETTITLRGRVGSIPASYERKDAKGIIVRFRFAVSNWRRKEDGTFVESEATWYTVRVWDKLAENTLESVSKGDPLIVVGRPSVNAWIDRDGLARGELVVTAQGIGFDMNHGRSRFIRPERRQDGPPPGQEPTGDAVVSEGAETSPASIDAGSWSTEASGTAGTDPTRGLGTPDRPLGTVLVEDADEEVDDDDDLTDQELAMAMAGVSDGTPGR